MQGVTFNVLPDLYSVAGVLVGGVILAAIALASLHGWARSRAQHYLLVHGTRTEESCGLLDEVHYWPDDNLLREPLERDIRHRVRTRLTAPLVTVIIFATAVGVSVPLFQSWGDRAAAIEPRCEATLEIDHIAGAVLDGEAQVGKCALHQDGLTFTATRD